MWSVVLIDFIPMECRLIKVEVVLHTNVTIMFTDIVRAAEWCSVNISKTNGYCIIVTGAEE